MARYALLIEYDGTPFSGWQRQVGQPSVQAALEAALAALNDGLAPTVHAAGRTDAGVHAAGQVAHVDIAREIAGDKLAAALNFHLRPAPVSVLIARSVPDDFEARFDAAARHYRYIIYNRRADLALLRGRGWRVAQALDADAMHDGAQTLVGYHDFSTFRDAECQAESPMRTLTAIEVSRAGERIDITCSAPSFLHRQVRSIVGSLVEVGRRQQPPGWMGEILKAADRGRCGPVAPACGLYLERVDYASNPFWDANQSPMARV